MASGQTHKTGFQYFLVVPFKISDHHLQSILHGRTENSSHNCLFIVCLLFLNLQKLFVVESDGITETQLESSSPSPSAQITSSAEHSNLPSTSSELMNCVCIICRSLPVTRAFLPCRHACVCGLCFQQLSYCPMCRAHIQSYFIVQEESFMDNAESHTTTELQGMSVGEILRGVFSAS